MAAPQGTQLIVKLLFPLCSALMLGTAFLVVHNFEPVQRGFFCNDENLKHPFINNEKGGEKVPSTLAAIIWGVLTLAIIVPTELFRSWLVPRPKEALRLVKAGPGLPWILVDIGRVLFHVLLGGLVTLLLTEMAKVTIGRLRPHFLTLCDPDLGSDYCKGTGGGDMGFVGSIVDKRNITLICRGYAHAAEAEDAEEFDKEIHEARLSFLSGHSSTAFYAATFLVLYLQTRLDGLPTHTAHTARAALKAFRPVTQAFLLSLALYIAFSRISDYFHHPMDVAMGSLLGIVMACLTFSSSGLHSQPEAFGRYYHQDKSNKDRSSTKTRMEDFERAT